MNVLKKLTSRLSSSHSTPRQSVTSNLLTPTFRNSTLTTEDVFLIIYHGLRYNMEQLTPLRHNEYGFENFSHFFKTRLDSFIIETSFTRINQENICHVRITDEKTGDVIALGGKRFLTHAFYQEQLKHLSCSYEEINQSYLILVIEKSIQATRCQQALLSLYQQTKEKEQGLIQETYA